MHARHIALPKSRIMRWGAQMTGRPTVTAAAPVNATRVHMGRRFTQTGAYIFESVYILRAKVRLCKANRPHHRY
jgi:hypothetical protein